ncbi:phage protein Gp37 [Varunaivibrio sulfuroxidans]|uniref:Phage gp37-like protein n=1 Tax=Varunaivibrio sulfuroxidans TaxID=1773489 RepID=A0A4R3JAJ9_9PROT|nr:phage protein Gp37 [Varunaivibrio sulfuroxidans]TCS62584.1 phage gp37-like protein [Varunaivibrio sulfuroxidans]WES30747.1 DUF1834 family protein [Varunaivibrio sulfuroxidans]
MIGAIEQAIIDRVAAAVAAGALGWTPRAVESYGDQLGGANLRQATQSFPAVFVMYGGEPRPEDGPGGKTRHRPAFTVFLCQKNRRNEAAQRRGAGGKVGTYQMLEDIRALLDGRDLGLAIDPIRPGAVRSILQNKDASIYALELHTSYDENPRAVDAGALGAFSTFHADWDIPPHGNVAPPLPAATPDAADTLTNLEI